MLERQKERRVHPAVAQGDVHLCWQRKEGAARDAERLEATTRSKPILERGRESERGGEGDHENSSERWGETDRICWKGKPNTDQQTALVLDM